MKYAETYIEAGLGMFRVNSSDPWISFTGSLKDAVNEHMVAEGTAGKVISVKNVKLINDTSNLLKIKYTIPKLTSEAKLDVLRRREGGERLQAIADRYSISKQFVHQLCYRNGVTKVPPADRIVRAEEAVCTVCDKPFTRVGSQVISVRKTCSDECLRKVNIRGGKYSKHEFITLKCAVCSKEFERSNYLQSVYEKSNKSSKYYCCRGCYHASRGVSNASPVK